jgi:hypothetical protein
MVTLHFDLSHLEPEAEYFLSAFGRRHLLRPHSGKTRKGAENRWLAVGGVEPSHVLDAVDLPEDQIQLLRLYGPPGEQGIPSLAAIYLYVPAAPAVAAWDGVLEALPSSPTPPESSMPRIPPRPWSSATRS